MKVGGIITTELNVEVSDNETVKASNVNPARRVTLSPPPKSKTMSDNSDLVATTVERFLRDNGHDMEHLNDLLLYSRSLVNRTWTESDFLRMVARLIGSSGSVLFALLSPLIFPPRRAPKASRSTVLPPTLDDQNSTSTMSTHKSMFDTINNVVLENVGILQEYNHQFGNEHRGPNGGGDVPPPEDNQIIPNLNHPELNDGHIGAEENHAVLNWDHGFVDVADDGDVQPQEGVQEDSPLRGEEYSSTLEYSNSSGGNPQ